MLSATEGRFRGRTTIELPGVRVEAAPAPAVVAKPARKRVGFRESVRALRHTRLDRSLFLTMFGVTTFGVVAVFTASFPLAGRPASGGGSNDPYVYMRQQAIYAGIGLFLCVFISYLRPSFIRRWATLWMAVGLGLMGYCAVRGISVNGSSSWMALGGVRFQPCEFAKLAYLIYLASVLSDGSDFFRDGTRLLTTGALMLVMCGLLAAQNDLGMVGLCVVTTFAVVYLSGTQWWALLGSAFAVGGVGVLAVVADRGRHMGHVIPRIVAWLAPEKHLDGAGGHIANMLATLTSGGLMGEGLGMGGDKWKALFAPHTDAIFCVICGELGVLGAASLLLLLALVTFHCYRIAAGAGSRYGWLLAVGIGTALGFQTLTNVAVATNAIPCTGMTLPFISAGGSSLIASMMAVGIVLSIARWKDEGADAQ
jgi:cell division protein FtsW